MATMHTIEERAALLCRVMAAVDSASVALAWWTDDGPLGIETRGWRMRKVRESQASDYAHLDGRYNTHAIEREGMLYTARGSQVVALTHALILPRRLPRVVRIDTGLFDPEDDREPVAPTKVPLGEALASHYVKVERSHATARPIFGNCDSSGQPLAVRCSAVLYVDQRPAALVREDITMTLLEEFTPSAELFDTFPPPSSLPTCPAEVSDTCPA